MAEYNFHLVIKQGSNVGRIIPLTEPSINIGRDPMSDVVLEDVEVSRHHLRLTFSESGFELQDMGSTNGTFVDGVRLSGERVLLKPGQLIRLGTSVVLAYEMADPQADPQATIVSDADELPSLPPLPSLDDEEELPDFSFRDTDTLLADESKGQAIGEDYPPPPKQDSPDFDQSTDLPDFDAGPVQPPPADPSPPSSGVAPATPPPAPPVAEAAPGGGSRRWWIIGALVLLLCCCCSLFVTYQYLGDLLLEYLGVI